MKRARLMSVLTLAASLIFAVSCSDPVTPRSDVQLPPPQADLLGGVLGGVTGLVQNLGLLKCTPLPYAEATQTIGPGGGFLRVGPHFLVIPPGALSNPVTITATAPSGTVNFIRFEPQGLVFQVPAALTMSYANCNLLGKLLPKRIAYTTDDLRILSYLLSLDLLNLRTVTGKLNHFSGYAVAW